MTILISAANSDIADSLCRIYRSEYPREKIYGVAPDGMWPASAVFDKVYKIAKVDDPEYLKMLFAILVSESIDIFVPVSEHELRFFAKNVISWPSKVKILINPQSILSVCLNKMHTVHWLDKIGVKSPQTIQLDQVNSGHLPIFVKPKESAGSKYSYTVHTWEYFNVLIKELQYLGIKLEDMIAQSYLTNLEEEYTCALSKINGQESYLILKRKLLGGITGKAETSQHPGIIRILKKISNAFKGDFFINVQLRLEKDEPFVFEINPRFSSTVMLRHLIGFQDFLEHIKFLKGGILPVPNYNINEKQMFRIFREVIV